MCFEVVLCIFEITMIIDEIINNIIDAENKVEKMMENWEDGALNGIWWLQKENGGYQKGPFSYYK